MYVYVVIIAGNIIVRHVLLIWNVMYFHIIRTRNLKVNPLFMSW